MKIIIVSFSYFEISIEMGTPTCILFNRRQGYTHAVKLKLWILEFQVTRILGDYAIGRLELRVIVTLPKLKSPSRPVL